MCGFRESYFSLDLLRSLYYPHSESNRVVIIRSGIIDVPRKTDSLDILLCYVVPGTNGKAHPHRVSIRPSATDS